MRYASMGATIVETFAEVIICMAFASVVAIAIAAFLERYDDVNPSGKTNWRSLAIGGAIGWAVALAFLVDSLPART